MSDFELYGTEAEKVAAAAGTKKAQSASGDDTSDGRNDTVAGDQLKAFIERIERMEEEKSAIASDIKEIYSEAKGNGFDTKVLREIIKIRKQDHNERMEHEALLELYLVALGMAAAG